jgi:phosphate transport system substrate-binding protein
VIPRAIAVIAACWLSAAWGDLVVPRDAPYLRADGSIHVVGDRTMEPLLARWNELFAKAHPRIRFTLHLGNTPVGLDGLIARVSIFAPIAHDAWESEIDPFKRLNGYLPLDVRVGRIGHAGARDNPPAIYVNVANPLRQLTIAEVGRIFTAGLQPGDLRRWSQLGVTDEWARHSIHVYGTRDDGTYVTALRIARFGGHPFARHYEALANDAEVLQALAGDRYGIGLAAAIDARRVPASVKLVPLSVAAGANASTGEYEEVRQGRYPLSPYLHIYLDLAPGRAIDPIAREYLKLALSAEGQGIIEQLKLARPGFVPLTAEEAAHELAKID